MQKNSWIGKQTEPINRLVNKWQQHKMKPKIKTTATQNQNMKQNKTKQSQTKQNKNWIKMWHSLKHRR